MQNIYGHARKALLVIHTRLRTTGLFSNQGQFTKCHRLFKLSRQLSVRSRGEGKSPRHIHFADLIFQYFNFHSPVLFTLLGISVVGDRFCGPVTLGFDPAFINAFFNQICFNRIGSFLG